MKTSYTLQELEDPEIFKESCDNLQKIYSEKVDFCEKGFDSFEEAMKDINSNSKITSSKEIEALMQILN